jgi:hypothetical protein
MNATKQQANGNNNNKHLGYYTKHQLYYTLF